MESLQLDDAGDHFSLVCALLAFRVRVKDLQGAERIYEQEKERGRWMISMPPFFSVVFCRVIMFVNP